MRAASQNSAAYVRYESAGPAPAPLLASAFTGHKAAKPRVVKDVVSPVKRLSGRFAPDGCAATDGSGGMDGAEGSGRDRELSSAGSNLDLTLPYALGPVPLPAVDAQFVVAMGTGLGGSSGGGGVGISTGARRDIATEAARREAALVSR